MRSNLLCISNCSTAIIGPQSGENELLTRRVPVLCHYQLQNFTIGTTWGSKSPDFALSPLASFERGDDCRRWEVCTINPVENTRRRHLWSTWNKPPGTVFITGDNSYPPSRPCPVRELVQDTLRGPWQCLFRNKEGSCFFSNACGTWQGCVKFCCKPGSRQSNGGLYCTAGNDVI